MEIGFIHARAQVRAATLVSCDSGNLEIHYLWSMEPREV